MALPVLTDIRDLCVPCSIRILVGNLDAGSMSMTLETWIDFSN